MKRRKFIATGVLAAAATTLPKVLSAYKSTIESEQYSIGDFILHHDGNILRISHKKRPELILWETALDRVITMIRFRQMSKY